MIIAIIIITSVISVMAFSNPELLNRLQFNAYAIKNKKQGWRFFTYGLVHAGWGHLAINMFVFWSFGKIVFFLYQSHFGKIGILYFLLLYVGGIMFSVLFDYRRHKNDPWYNAVGASGAVAAVVFASIILYPSGGVYLFFIPIEIPSPIFGILYLVYSAYMARRGRDNIGHDAHFWGSVYGILLTVALKPQLFLDFIHQVGNLF
ncbi:MAG: rhomboid family intramembrane serine protease [Bacteroidetes bacterium]|nr:rhomboid family intramembrane serine protease [Bacteroidota bacterium]